MPLPLSTTRSGGFSSHALPPDSAATRANRDVQQIGRRKPPRHKGPRRLEIEAQHRHQLARAFAYRAAQARTQDELEALEREYHRLEAQGPDFTHYRSKSNYGAPPRHGLDGNAVAKLRHQFNSMARNSSKERAKGKHRGLISRTCKEVYNALLDLAKVHGALFPSYATLARLADCSPRSVATAIAILEQLGWITKHRRLKVVEGLLGRKAEQTSNAYEIHPPRAGRGLLAWLFFVKPESDCKNRQPTLTACLSYLTAHPETWGSPGVTRGDAYGGLPSAARS